MRSAGSTDSSGPRWRLQNPDGRHADGSPQSQQPPDGVGRMEAHAHSRVVLPPSESVQLGIRFVPERKRRRRRHRLGHKRLNLD